MICLLGNTAKRSFWFQASKLINKLGFKFSLESKWWLVPCLLLEMECDSRGESLLPVPHFLHLEIMFITLTWQVKRKNILIHKLLFSLTWKGYDIKRQILLKFDEIGKILLVKRCISVIYFFFLLQMTVIFYFI